MKSNEICGTCEWHHRERTNGEDWVCTNARSDNCTEYTEYGDSCDDWEEKA